MNLLAIDPGTTESAMAWWSPYRPILFGKFDNSVALERIARFCSENASKGNVVCEKIESYGMPVGAEVFDTVEWCGRYRQTVDDRCARWHYLPRRAIKLSLCGDSRAKDANVRQALLDLFGGKDKAIGKKKTPGPLYGISGDMWSALAVGVTYLRQQNERVDRFPADPEGDVKRLLEAGV